MPAGRTVRLQEVGTVLMILRVQPVPGGEAEDDHLALQPGVGFVEADEDSGVAGAVFAEDVIDRVVDPFPPQGGELAGAFERLGAVFAGDVFPFSAEIASPDYRAETGTQRRSAGNGARFDGAAQRGQDRRQLVVVVVHIQGKGNSLLLQVAGALDALGAFPGVIERGQQHRRQNRDDRYRKMEKNSYLLHSYCLKQTSYEINKFCN